jgi:5-(carboxyamino)imidazole ribonucleotide synthase
MKIGIIGGGQLAYMLGENIDKNIFNSVEKIYIFSDKFDIPCNLLKDMDKVDIIYGEYNLKNIIKFSEKCDIITYEFENIDINILKKIEKPIYPDIKYLEIIQDKFIQKEFLRKNNLSVGPYSVINTEADIYNFIEKYNYPIILKARRGSFDGRGNIVIKNREELEIFVKTNNDIIENYYVEDYINFENELSIGGCKNNGVINCYEPVKNVHKNNILIKTEYNDDSIKKDIKIKIKKVYENLLNLFDTRGVICCEFFEYNNDVYINEIALRVHNTYHISMDCCNISQFELHLRSILDLEIPKLNFIKNGYMYNIISNLQKEEDILDIYEKMKAKYEIKVKKYNKKLLGIRKIGHVNFVEI